MNVITNTAITTVPSSDCNDPLTSPAAGCTVVCGAVIIGVGGGGSGDSAPGNGGSGSRDSGACCSRDWSSDRFITSHFTSLATAIPAPAWLPPIAAATPGRTAIAAPHPAQPSSWLNLAPVL